MKQISRRHMIALGVGGLTAMGLTWRSGFARGAEGSSRKFTMDLNWGAIGVRANQLQALELAAEFGFEAVDADPGFLSALDDAARADLAASMQQHGIVWGAAGLPVDFRGDEQTFRKGLKSLPTLAKGLQLAGVTRVGTWLRPSHDELSYVANFRQHARRLRECARILGDHGQRFGMEYVGPKTAWTSARHSFIHSMAETKDLIAEIGQDNVGLVLDSWHWYTAHETADDLRSLSSGEIIACDLNDAPQGLAIDDQIDNRRELPATTGVIDLRTFLSILVEIGYDGPIRAEPFNAALNAMDNSEACRATATAMTKAFALLG